MVPPGSAAPSETNLVSALSLRVLSLRYSSWSIRPWLALTEASAPFSTETVDIEDLAAQGIDTGPALTSISEAQLARRRSQGSITGLFPVLYVDGKPIHESLAICEWAAEAFPEAGRWPDVAFERARARAVSCEMVAGFQQLRTHMSCNVFARVPKWVRSAALERDIKRVLEIWRDSLDASGGPFLFGKFSIADCLYFPVLTRFRTYAIELDSHGQNYARALESHDTIEKWRRMALTAPSIPVYDEAIRRLGGDPEAGRQPHSIP
jgi:glutathione S-transferase